MRNRAANNGVMKEKINVQQRKNITTHLSSQAKTVMQAALSHDIELYNYARNTLWDKQAMFRISKEKRKRKSKKSKPLNRINI